PVVCHGDSLVHPPLLRVQRRNDEVEGRQLQCGNGGKQRVAAGDQLRLPDRDGGKHGGGEVGRRFRILQRGQAPDQGGVEGQRGTAAGASLAVFASSEPLGTAQRAVGQRLQLGISEVAHDRCSASFAISSLRARCSHVITVP